jgi:hypothetical protein
MLGAVQREPVIPFDVDGVRHAIRVEDVSELVRRLRRNPSIILSPARAAAIRLEQVIEEPTAAAGAPEWLEDEREALRRAVEEWFSEVGASNFPEDMTAFRYALVAEARPGHESGS